MFIIIINKPVSDIICVLHYVTTVTSYGRVTSSVTWQFDSASGTSSSVEFKPVSCLVFEVYRRTYRRPLC